MKKNIRWQEKMPPEQIYQIAYQMIGKATPLKGMDCGKLCRGICCEGDEETGMYLYPFEEKCFLKHDSWYRIIFSDFVYDKNRVKILTCPGTCVRSERPLACRIFPLAPYQKSREDKLQIIIDPRSYSLCPLAHGVAQNKVDPLFYNRVFRVFSFLNQYEPIHQFIVEMSYQMDEYFHFLP